MQEKITKLNRYFEEQIALCGRRNRELLADERPDEAVFEKVQANIYDIFRTVLSAAVQAGKEDPEAARRFFLQKAEQIPSAWSAAYEKARQHDDAVRMQTERIKLDTIRKIREAFAAIWEEDP